MDELNQNESAVIEETAEHNEAMKYDPYGNYGEKQKNNNSNLLKAGIALMFATSVLSLGVSCYQIFSKDDNKVEQAQNMIGSVNYGELTFEEIDGYIYVNGKNTGIEISTIDGKDGVSVVDARVIELDKWGITTQILFTMSDGSYVSTPAQKQVLSEHFYEAESVNDVVRLATEFKVPNIRLSSNLTLNESIDFAKSVCFDLNGKTLTYTVEDALTVGNNATLKFKNGTVNFQTEVAVSVEGTNAGVAFDGVKVNATAVVAETLAENASIKVVNSTITTVEAEVANFAFGSYESLFVVKGANAEVVVKETKVTTDRVIVAAKEDAEKISLSVESTKLNTSAPVLDINTDEVVPTLDIDEETLYSNYVELNTSTLTSGNYNFDLNQIHADFEGETFDVDGKVVIAEDFASLVEIVEAGATINLTRDIDLAKTVQVTKKVIIDLNGHKLFNTTDIWNTAIKDWSLISVRGGDLTIKNGTLEAKANDCHAIDVKSGSLTIESGRYLGNISAIYVLEGNVTINGGTFDVVQLSEFKDKRYLVNCLDDAYRAGSAVVTINGGSFVGFNPVNNLAEGPNTNFVAEGYMVGGFEGMYAVVEADVDLIKEAIAYGELEYLAINADITLDETITVSNNLTINLLGNTITTTGEYAAFDLVAGNLVVDNGTINAYYDAFGVYGTGTRVVLDLGSKLTVVSETANCVYIKGQGANLVTSANLTSNSANYACIQGNGNLVNRIESITVNGGVITSTSNVAIFAPQTGVLNIAGGEVRGTTALYVKSGVVNISGGKLVATGEKIGYVYNGNGGDATGDALVIDACGYPGGNPTVNITGGEFVSANAEAIAYYSYKDNTAVITANGYEVATYVVATTETELAAAIANQAVETIILGSNITLTSTIEVTRNVTINLGGKTITTTGKYAAFDITAGNVVVDNGSIDAYYDAFGVYGSGEKVVLNLGANLSVVSETANCVYVKGAGANLVTSANLTSYSTEYAAIQGNGNLSSRIESITINGGLVYSVYNQAIYAPQTGTMNITGGEIKGTTALYVKSGNVNISGGKFIATGEYKNYVYNGNGTATNGDALVIDSCGYPGGYPVVTITGGEFVVADSNAHEIAYYIYDGNNALVSAPAYTVVSLIIPR